MKCRLCQSTVFAPVPFEIPEWQGKWVRCCLCDSDSAEHDYPLGLYNSEYETAQVKITGGQEEAQNQISSNLDWFSHYTEGLANRDFLDVGCCDGAALRGMQARGWAVHGFDVFEPSYMDTHITVAPFFHRWLFPLRYSAVLAREVFEHVQYPQLFLVELHGVTIPNGLVQVQTPIPLNHYHGIPYQRAHLHLASVKQMKAMLHVAMLDIIDERFWELGQAYLCRARA